MTVQFHYCCGKLKNVDWSPVKRIGCGNEHKMGSKPCCETKQFVANATDHFNFIEESNTLKVYESDFIQAITIIEQASVCKPMVLTAVQSPPVDTSPLFLQHCVFRL